MKQLILCADMEGASGIFEENRDALRHEEIYPQGKLWRQFGRAALTSDILAACQGANDAGADEILLYDGHYAGCAEFNVILERLPSNVRVFDLPERRFFWRRIRGQAALRPWALITVGQHARYGEENAYFPHTIQSPPIQGFWVNGLHIAELGQAALSFRGVPYAANVGCAASHREARELSPQVSCISVKDKVKNWKPSPEQTFPLIRQGVRQALEDLDRKTAVEMDGPCQCRMELTPGYRFQPPARISWKGDFARTEAFWEAPYVEMALELFNEVREHIVKE